MAQFVWKSKRMHFYPFRPQGCQLQQGKQPCQSNSNVYMQLEACNSFPTYQSSLHTSQSLPVEGAFLLNTEREGLVRSNQSKGLAVWVYDQNQKGVYTAWLDMVKKAVIDYRMSSSSIRHSAAKRMRYQVSIGCQVNSPVTLSLLGSCHRLYSLVQSVALLLGLSG